MIYLRKFNSIYLIISLCIIFIFISKTGDDISLPIVFGELGIIEISQFIILIIGVYKMIINKKLLFKAYNKQSYYIRLLFTIFIAYEEISFLTSGLFKFVQKYNIKGEFNLHNSYFLLTDLPLRFPIFDTVIIDSVLISSILFIIGYGYRITKIKKYKMLFLESKFSIFFLLYPVNILLRNLFSSYIINFELIELVLYSIFVLDIFEKIHSYENSSKTIDPI
tara:strand:- start:962 stop:1627 length:666 start_codon:yes stop_codon:yes gene_type:complete